ncbi:MAG: single-stranded-DNA-specific exonuclease RecJ [Magnetococcales bacterium]|nr:single-stranded-DNA-specific exonuclease RecJ [Magnetococcales bacterium]
MDTLFSTLSLKGRVWKARALPGQEHNRLADKLGLSPGLAPMLAHRRIDDQESAGLFFHPTLKQLPDPHDLKDMQRAVRRVIEALENKQSIAVFGDYDVDGTTSSALMARYFRALGVTIRIYIPNRLTEGYGPNADAIRLLKEEGTDLLLTVDCGITSFDELELASELGMDVIVTDHHQQSPRGLPKAVAVVNPNRADDTSSHTMLAGVGVAFYLVLAINRELRTQGWFTSSRPEPDTRNLMDLVALGTVADMVSLTGANRPLVSAGLRWSGRTGNLGFNALAQAVGATIPIKSDHIGFRLGPRINAAGRLGKTGLGVTLLTTDDPEQAKMLAETLNTLNQERRTIEQTVLNEATEQIEAIKNLEEKRGLVVMGRGWHPGVIGIVASRLMDRHHRPTLVISMNQGGEGTGSGRSIPGINLLEAIRAGSDHLIRYGGHAAAAGFMVKEEALESFSTAFEQELHQTNPPEKFQPVMLFDTILPLSLATQPGIISDLSRFEPYGMGNPEPVIVIKNVRIQDQKVLSGKHLRLNLVDPEYDRVLEAIAFNILPGPLGETLLTVPPDRPVRVAGTLSENTYRGQTRLQIILIDAGF